MSQQIQPTGCPSLFYIGVPCMQCEHSKKGPNNMYNPNLAGASAKPATPATASSSNQQAQEESKQSSKKEKKGKEPKEEGKGGMTEKERKKAERMASRQAAATKKDDEFVKDPNDKSAHLFGDRELNRSQCDPKLRFTKKYVEIKDLGDEHVGQDVIIRGRVHNSRKQGKNLAFLVIRQAFSSVQVVVAKSDTVSPGMVEYSYKLPKESIVEVKASVTKPGQALAGCSQQVELAAIEFWGLNKSAPMLPFQIEDASRLVLDQAAEDDKPDKKKGEEEEQSGEKLPVVKQDVRLNNRIIDLRVPTNQAIMRLQSGVCNIYRSFLYTKDFVEIHTPKLIGGSSEGGANVFKLKYFEQDACMAQSPQLYKQMALCGDLQRVFEIGPVFRAENSNTNRHLCEFTGLDLEMEFKNHYFEVLDLIGELMVYMFKNIKEKHAAELAVINEQYPFEEFKCADPVLKLHFKDGVKMLWAAGIEQAIDDDLSTETEKALGRLVREKYDTDFYMLYGYPEAARPFYTMPDPNDPGYTNSYDFFMRGEEITSGAQRIHDPVLLEKRAKEKGIAVETIKDYIDAFKYGVSCHAGAGFGMERVVKFYCNLHNIRKASLFPRDPKRLTP